MKYPRLGYSVVCTSKSRFFKSVYKLESAINIWTSSSVQHKKVDTYLIRIKANLLKLVQRYIKQAMLS